MHYLLTALKLTRRCSGFSLLELSIVVVIVGIMIASIMPAVSYKARVEKRMELLQKMDAIEQALQAFRVQNDRLPCPADITMNDANANFGVEAATPGTCTGGTPAATSPATDVVLGGVPVRTLGLEDDMAYDAWGRAFTYMVDGRMTAAAAYTTYVIDDTTPGNITVRARDEALDSLSDLTTKAIAVVLSSGNNGHGGYMRSGSRYSFGSTNADELENCNCNSSAAVGTENATFITTVQSGSVAGGVTGYDDVLRYYSRGSFTTAEDLE